MKRGNVCRCVFKKPPLGDLAVPERVDVCPLLLDRVARRLADTTLKPHDDDGVALGDELARLEPDLLTNPAKHSCRDTGRNSKALKVPR